ncbi:MAG: SusD/RagB family nutrient-binding outer membrane lipoprotein [Cyclobacteriaceae bacterium]
MKKIFLIILLITGTMVSCEDYLDVNVDPNNPTVVGPDLILPVGQNYTARWIDTDRSVNHLGNMMMYNLSESAGYSWYNDEFLYLASSSTFYDQIFDNAYLLALKQYHKLETLEGENNEAYQAIGKIMKAYTFQILVDFYGDIPYFNALQGSENANPEYDNAQGIYDDLIVQLTAAIDLLDQAAANELTVVPGDDDAMFGGDLTSWKQFANSIKLRILTRESDVKDAAYITQELAVIANGGSGYITGDVAVNPGYSNQEDKQNPYWEDFGKDPSGSFTLSHLATCASDYIINYLNNTGDDRIDFIFEEPATGHLGVPQGITADNAVYHPDLVSNLGDGVLKDADMGSIIYTLAETYFNEAELALKGFGGDPKALYEEGVKASFNTLGASNVDSYLAQGLQNVNYDASTNKLQAIITQKWLATVALTAEQAWFDHSRTGFPAGLPVSQEVPNLVRPVRLSYPASEVGGNSLNKPSQPDVYTAKVFWGN